VFMIERISFHVAELGIGFLTAVGLTLVGAFVVQYMLRAVEVPKVLVKSGSITESIVRVCEHLHEKYYPPLFFYSGHSQTILSAVFRPKSKVDYQRELFSLSDGGTVALDWAFPPSDGAETTTDSPILVLLHGITGGSSESYITSLGSEALKLGWTVCAFNARGCSDSVVTSRKFYSGGFTDDVRAVVRAVHDRYPARPQVAAGFSLGANVLTKYLGEEGNLTPLVAAVALANPLDFVRGSVLLNSGFSRLVYSSTMTKRLRAYVRRHQHMFPERASLERALAARSVLEFDEAATALAFGYKNALEYYQDASSGPRLGGVRCPLLLLSAADDPIAPPRPEYMDNASEFVCMAITTHGGHCAWAEGLVPYRSCWSDRVTLEFLANSVEASRTELVRAAAKDGFVCMAP